MISLSILLGFFLCEGTTMMTDNSLIYILTVSKSLLIVLGTFSCPLSQTPNYSKLAGLLVKDKTSLTSTRPLLGLFCLGQKKWQFRPQTDGDDCQHRESLLSVASCLIHPAHAGNPSHFPLPDNHLLARLHVRRIAARAITRRNRMIMLKFAPISRP